MSDRTREPLSRDAVVTAAIALADAEGVGGLTMRRIADRLGYRVMALYNHIANKDDLLGLMVDAVAAEVEAPSPDVEPLAGVRAMAISTREALVRHPWAPSLWLQHVPGPARTRNMEDLLRTLDATGLPPEIAHHGFHAVTNHVLGYTMQEQGMAANDADPGDAEARAAAFVAGMSEDEHPYTIAHVRQHLDGQTASSFELVLDLILDGLVRLAE